MAEVNTDGSKASAGQRFYNAATNGSGAITSRMVVVVMIPILTGLVGLMWNDLRAGQRDVQEAISKLRTDVTTQGQSIVGNATRIDGIVTGQQRIWQTLGGHSEHIEAVDKRLTSLESCQPNCHPR